MSFWEKLNCSNPLDKASRKWQVKTPQSNMFSCWGVSCGGESACNMDWNKEMTDLQSMIFPAGEIKRLFSLVPMLRVEVHAQQLHWVSILWRTKSTNKHTLNTLLLSIAMLSYDSIRLRLKLIAAAVQCELLWFIGMRMISLENRSNCFVFSDEVGINNKADYSPSLSISLDDPSRILRLSAWTKKMYWNNAHSKVAQAHPH